MCYVFFSSCATEEIATVDAVDDIVTTTENIFVGIEVLVNDKNLPTNFSIERTAPANGIVEINTNDTPNILTDDILVYTPNPRFSGTDSFEYTSCDLDNAENCDTARVNITVEPRENDFATELKAFPSAYGGGAYATGGRGGSVYHVSNLDDSGLGSFRWALKQPRQAIIVFDVAGTINIETSWLDIGGENLTIAGQTAPVVGITIASTTEQRLRFRGNCRNIIMRYIKIRPLETGSDAFELYSKDFSENIILDHISASYGGDEALSIRGNETHNITFQRCLIADSKTGSLFGDLNSYDNSMLNCLFWNVSHRHSNPSSDGRVDISSKY